MSMNDERERKERKGLKKKMERMRMRIKEKNIRYNIAHQSPPPLSLSCIFASFEFLVKKV